MLAAADVAAAAAAVKCDITAPLISCISLSPLSLFVVAGVIVVATLCLAV